MNIIKKATALLNYKKLCNNEYHPIVCDSLLNFSQNEIRSLIEYGLYGYHILFMQKANNLLPFKIKIF